MKVLFVASGNKKFGVSSFVAAQAKSLNEAGVDVRVFPVVGRGWKGYFRNIFKLSRVIKSENPDIVHAHYSTSGILASIVTSKPILTSILGSFPNPDSRKAKRVRFFINHVWAGTIVKSERTARQLGIDGLHIIPSGVNLQQFVPCPYIEARKTLGFEDGRKYVIFVSNPERPEKNYTLASKSVEMLQSENVTLVPVFDKTHDEVVRYMSAADVLVLTSMSEGSPNVIKEALACNCPIVSTDVGDVRQRLEGLDGCYVADGDSMVVDNDVLLKDFSAKLAMALQFGRRTEGRNRIIEDGISSGQIAERIIEVYNSVLKR